MSILHLLGFASTCAVVLNLAAHSAEVPPAAPASAWSTDLAAEQKAAAQDGKLVVVLIRNPHNVGSIDAGYWVQDPAVAALSAGFHRVMLWNFDPAAKALAGKPNDGFVFLTPKGEQIAAEDVPDLRAEMKALYETIARWPMPADELAKAAAADPKDLDRTARAMKVLASMGRADHAQQLLKLAVPQGQPVPEKLAAESENFSWLAPLHTSQRLASIEELLSKYLKAEKPEARPKLDDLQASLQGIQASTLYGAKEDEVLQKDALVASGDLAVLIKDPAAAAQEKAFRTRLEALAATVKARADELAKAAREIRKTRRKKAEGSGENQAADADEKPLAAQLLELIEKQQPKDEPKARELVAKILAQPLTSREMRRGLGVIVYAMGMAVNAIPGAGLLSVWVATITGSEYYATPENQWMRLINHRIPSAWTLHDPPADVKGAARPIEWFYSGLPPGKSIPWQAWIGPFVTWSVAFALLFMTMFALCLLLRRQWSERERLPFPLAQLPEDLTAGLHSGRGVPFLKDPMAQIGIGLVLALHLWNGLQDYNSRIPEIPLRPSIHSYMSEPPWRHLLPLYTKIFPSVIGFTFLLSLEVSFSLWFFFVVMKIGQFAAIKNGIGYDGWYFFSRGEHHGIFVDQGIGALIAMVLAGLYLARGELSGSLREALGLKSPEPRPDDFSPRALWLLLIACVAGSVAWLGWFGVSILYALPCVILLGVVMIGFTRVFCEGGVFYTQMYEFPSQLVSTVATPAVMGSQNYFLLSMYDRVMVADSFRVLTMPNLMNALHLASRAGLRLRSMTWGLVAALLLALPLGFAAVLYTGYTAAGGIKDTDWVWRSYPNGEFKSHEDTLSKLDSWDRRVETARQSGKEIPKAEVPDVARRDWLRLGWLGAGMAGMFVMLFLRTRLFWWPHPIGYVMWMGQWSLNNQWFSFFLGWCLKWVCLRYGGRRTYLDARRFFLGVIVGEALAAMFWIVIACWAGTQDGYRISID